MYMHVYRYPYWYVPHVTWNADRTGTTNGKVVCCMSKLWNNRVGFCRYQNQNSMDKNLAKLSISFKAKYISRNTMTKFFHFLPPKFHSLYIFTLESSIFLKIVWGSLYFTVLERTYTMFWNVRIGMQFVRVVAFLSKPV